VSIVVGMKRTVICLVATIGLAAGLVAGGTGGANAYPPGTALTLSASPNPVAVGAVVTATARHVGPGCKVKFVLGAASITVSSSVAGNASARLRAPATAGARTMSATTTGCATIERAYTRVVVTGPLVRCPTTVHRNRVFTCTVSRFPARASVVVKFSKGRISVTQRKVVSRTGAATYHFKLSSTGTYLVTAVNGRRYATTTVKVVR
jgi:hypothetical protein